MRATACVMLYCLFFLCGYARQSAGNDNNSINKQYSTAIDCPNDLVHTRLQIKFDYTQACADGKVWITLRPHFYETDSLVLDAKGMLIYQVGLVKKEGSLPLKYDYNGEVVKIRLDRKYTRNERYQVFISYRSQPGKLKANGKDAAMFNKGLYFINPDGSDPDKPTQVWTHGEPEATSVWCPTIDKPNQRTTVEMYINVPVKYVTVSNGLLVNKTKEADGTRTDHWKMDQPHAPYLFFIGVGDFAVVKDTWRQKEVSYYVEPAYAPLAKQIFGVTPEMIEFFSQITGIAFPWQKYSQIVVRDFFTGGMENTTVTLHNEAAQQDSRELADGNKWETNIAHELFHQWFGNYVTAESWGNIVLSEGFATYAEILWYEHKYGKEKADERAYNLLLNYLYSRSENKALVRNDYHSPLDMFDVVSYNKGAQVLRMLREYVGDQAFFASIKNFLTANNGKPVEVPQLRLAFEEITGQDLNWFFDQWYNRTGHPRLDIKYDYNDTTGMVQVTIRQMQNGAPYRMPLMIDVYTGEKKTRYPVEINGEKEVFTFNYRIRPDLINVDAEKVTVCEKKDRKEPHNFLHQYQYAGTLIDRREAVDYWASKQEDTAMLALLKMALQDKYAGIRFHTLMRIDLDKKQIKQAVEPLIAGLAAHDADKGVRARALHMLAAYNDHRYLSIFKAAVTDSSYSVSGEALEAMLVLDTPAVLQLAKGFRKQKIKGKLADVVTGVLMTNGTAEDFDFLASKFDRLALSEYKLEMLHLFAGCIEKVDDTEKMKKGIDIIVRFRDAIPSPYKQQTDPLINNVILKGMAKRKQARTETDSNPAINEQIRYINARLPQQ
jgi:aminopeptidase N